LGAVEVGAEGALAVVGPTEAVLQVGDAGGELGDLLLLGGAVGLEVGEEGEGGGFPRGEGAGEGRAPGFAVGAAIVGERVAGEEVGGLDGGDGFLWLRHRGEPEGLEEGGLLRAVPGRRLERGGGEDGFQHRRTGRGGAVGSVGAESRTAEDGEE
jgi:hypothetical protein